MDLPGVRNAAYQLATGFNGGHRTIARCWHTGRVISDEDLLAEIEQGILTDEPVSKTLRALLLLGGRLDSKNLATWAKRELNGYEGVPDADVPTARTVGAPIAIDAMVGYTQITGRGVSAAALPKPFSDVLKDEIVLRQSVSEIEALISNAHRVNRSHISLTIANWEAIGRVVDKDQFGQHTTAMYRQVSVSYLDAIVADVRNRAAELMGEFRRTARGKSHDIPRGRQADAIVSGVVVTGDNNSVVLATGKRTRISSSSKSESAPTDGTDKRGWWDAWGKVATVVTVVSGLIAVAVFLLGMIPPS